MTQISLSDPRVLRNDDDSDPELWLSAVEWTSSDIALFPLTRHGDYVGSTVERSNYETLLTEFALSPGFYSVYSDYGFHAIGFAPSEVAVGDVDTLRELILSLASYPSLNDDILSRIELELLDERFLDDFYSEFLRVYPEEDPESDWARNTVYEAVRDLVLSRGFGHPEGASGYSLDWDSAFAEFRSR
jgi:hypothetical protein